VLKLQIKKAGQLAVRNMGKFHLGSGARKLEGFTHVDIEPHKTADIVADISDLSGVFTEGSISEIYSSHALEYFDLLEAPSVLAGWHKLLKPGGGIYLSVPNIKSLIEIYKQSGDLRSILGPLFGRWKNENCNEVLYHKVVFDKSTLIEIMSEVGFVEIREFDPVDYLGRVDPNYDDYSLAYFPHMDRTGIQVSLCLTGMRAPS